MIISSKTWVRIKNKDSKEIFVYIHKGSSKGTKIEKMLNKHSVGGGLIEEMSNGELFIVPKWYHEAVVLENGKFKVQNSWEMKDDVIDDLIRFEEKAEKAGRIYSPADYVIDFKEKEINRS